MAAGIINITFLFQMSEFVMKGPVGASAAGKPNEPPKKYSIISHE